MAVLIEALNVIIRVSALERKPPASCRRSEFFPGLIQAAGGIN
jgi:hypothetical protein